MYLFSNTYKVSTQKYSTISIHLEPRIVFPILYLLKDIIKPDEIANSIFLGSPQNGEILVPTATPFQPLLLASIYFLSTNNVKVP